MLIKVIRLVDGELAVELAALLTESLPFHALHYTLRPRSAASTTLVLGFKLLRPLLRRRLQLLTWVRYFSRCFGRWSALGR